jgi:hypothetical protein
VSEWREVVAVPVPRDRDGLVEVLETSYGPLVREGEWRPLADYVISLMRGAQVCALQEASNEVQRECCRSVEQAGSSARAVEWNTAILDAACVIRNLAEAIAKGER